MTTNFGICDNLPFVFFKSFGLGEGVHDAR